MVRHVDRGAGASELSRRQGDLVCLERRPGPIDWLPAEENHSRCPAGGPAGRNSHIHLHRRDDRDRPDHPIDPLLDRRGLEAAGRPSRPDRWFCAGVADDQAPVDHLGAAWSSALGGPAPALGGCRWFRSHPGGARAGQLAAHSRVAGPDAECPPADAASDREFPLDRHHLVPAAEVGRVPILELLVALCVGRGTPARGLSEGCPGPIAASARRAGPGSPGRLHRRSLWPALRFPRPADPPLRAPGHPTFRDRGGGLVGRALALALFPVLDHGEARTGRPDRQAQPGVPLRLGPAVSGRGVADDGVPAIAPANADSARAGDRFLVPTLRNLLLVVLLGVFRFGPPPGEWLEVPAPPPGGTTM